MMGQDIPIRSSFKDGLLPATDIIKNLRRFLDVNLAPDSIAFVIEDFGGDNENASTLWFLRADVLPNDNKTIVSESLKIL
jgi:hypothetical protein